jgi:hypothetical protein
MATPGRTELAPYIDRLRELPFAREVELTERPARHGDEDVVVKIRTPRRTFMFTLLVKQTYLDHALTNALIAHHAARPKAPILLAARYIPRPTGERLAAAGVNFVDRVGNIHLALGEDHHVFLLGRRESAIEPTARRPGPALVQLYLVLLAEPNAAAWPVRRLAGEAGIGKTAAAMGLQRLVRLGVLTQDRDRRYRVADRPRLVDAFLQGYANVLRPHLEIGRFRAAERDQEAFIHRFAGTAGQVHAAWALTGAPAAYAMDRFYRGDDIPIFVDGFTAAMQRALRLLPDREGPIALLRPFGQRWTWKVIAGVPVAHPWLVYAELLHRGEPRALEAADHVREQFLAA